MANNKTGKKSKNEAQAVEKNYVVAEPKTTLASRKFIRLGTVQWSRLNWMAGLGGPVSVYILGFNFNYIFCRNNHSY